MYRITLVCNGIPDHAGEGSARDVGAEFRHRPWHQNVKCTWDGSRLTLQAENDFDSDGLALLDEFSDALSACLEAFEGDIEIVSITRL
jgi:hypothetical protein